MFLPNYNMRKTLFKLAFNEPWNPNDTRLLPVNLQMTSLFGRKFDGKQFEGYPCHSSTLKLSGK